jgi:hypothetical protein
MEERMPDEDKIDFPLKRPMTDKQKERLEALFRLVEAAYLEKTISRTDEPDRVSMTASVSNEGSDVMREAYGVVISVHV